jgi:hypothetical protein
MYYEKAKAQGKNSIITWPSIFEFGLNRFRKKLLYKAPISLHAGVMRIQ